MEFDRLDKVTVTLIKSIVASGAMLSHGLASQGDLNRDMTMASWS